MITCAVAVEPQGAEPYMALEPEAAKRANDRMYPPHSRIPKVRPVLCDHVKDHLLKAILSGQYRPGARIVETRVARELAVSQSPVREALRDLAALGVVEISAFQGARVHQASASELLNAFVVRTNLEQLAGRLAAPRLQNADVSHLERCIEAIDRAARAGDPHAEAVADAAFHEGIVELANNLVLLRAWRTTEPFLRTYISVFARGARAQTGDLHRPYLRRSGPITRGAS